MKISLHRGLFSAIAFAFSVLPGRTILAAEESFAPPVADEAHGLAGTDRQVALTVLRSHYQNILDAYNPLVLTGVNWSDPAKSARCEIRLSLPVNIYKAGTFVDGLPVRRGQPLVFAEFQRRLVSEVERCGSSQGMAFTMRTWAEFEESALALVMKNSGTTFCLKDQDCYGVEIQDQCGTRSPLRAFGSDTTDAVFFVAYRKFLWSFLDMSAQMVHGAINQLGDKHPDYQMSSGPARCSMKHWEERPIESRCIQHSCR